MKSKSIVLLFSFLLFACTINFYAQEFKEVEKSFPLEPNGAVTIDTYKGQIIVETWDKAEVHIYAKMIPDEDSWSFISTNPAKQLKAVDVEIDVSPNSVSIKSEYRKNDSWFGSSTRAFVNYKIKMPKSARLKIKDYKSETKIGSVQSEIEMETYKGDVSIYGLNGSIDFETYKGRAKVEFSKLADDSRFETYKGEIRIALPKNSAFTVDANLSKRTDFSSDFNIEPESRSRKNHNYDFKKEINGGGPMLKLSSERGEINLFEK